MSNEKFETLRPRGSGHGIRYAAMFPHGPFYPECLGVIQGRYATFGVGELARYTSDVFLGKVIRRLVKQPGVNTKPYPSKRYGPRTKPSRPWNMAVSFYFESVHVTVFTPNFLDFKCTDDTHASQHLVIFANTEDAAQVERAAQAFVTAHEDAYTSVWEDE